MLIISLCVTSRESSVECCLAMIDSTRKSQGHPSRVMLFIPAFDKTGRSLGTHTCKFIATCNDIYFAPGWRFLIFLADRKIVRQINTREKSMTMSLVIIIAISLSPSYTLRCITQVFFAIISYFIYLKVCLHCTIFRTTCLRRYDIRSFHACCKVCYYKMQSQFVFVIDVLKFRDIILYNFIIRFVLLNVPKFFTARF